MAILITGKEATAVRNLFRESRGDTSIRVYMVGDECGEKARITGERGYWTTPSGKTIVRYPNAYGWRTMYHKSTRRIEIPISRAMRMPEFRDAACDLVLGFRRAARTVWDKRRTGRR